MQCHENIFRFDAPQTPHLVGSSGSHSTAKDFPSSMQPPLIAGVNGNLITPFFCSVRVHLIFLLSFFSLYTQVFPVV